MKASCICLSLPVRCFNLLGLSGRQDYESSPDIDLSVHAHVTEFRRQLALAAQLPIRPIKINVHAGSDSWSEEQSAAFFDEALRVIRDEWDDEQSPSTVSFETHRGRALFQPFATERYLKKCTIWTYFQLTAYYL